MPEILGRYRITVTSSRMDRATGTRVKQTEELPAPPTWRRPKHILGYLQRAIDLGMMRVEPSAQGFRYHAFNSFFSLVEDPKRDLWYAYEPENRASREEQAKERRQELEACYQAEQRAEEQRRQEAFRREWEAGAEKRAEEAESHARQEEAWHLANTARIADGRLQCPHCGKTFLAHRDGSSGICKPEGCGRSFYLPKLLALCEACGRRQSVPEGKKHAVCDCGAFAWPARTVE